MGNIDFDLHPFSITELQELSKTACFDTPKQVETQLEIVETHLATYILATA